MKIQMLHSLTVITLSAFVLLACSSTQAPKVSGPINYGTSGVGPIDDGKARALLNCYLAGDTATKIAEMRGAGKSDDEIVRFYAASIDKSWMRLVYDMLPVVAKDNPSSDARVDYGRNVYRRCVSSALDEKRAGIAEYCYQQNQFVQLAFLFRGINEPMENAYTKMPAGPDAKVITEALLTRAKKVSREKETGFRLDTYYGCLGHPDKAPVSRS